MRRPLSMGLFALSLALASPIAATAGPKVLYDPEVGGVALVSKGEVGGPVNSQFQVSARGPEEVSNVTVAVTGVLFQAEARPDVNLESTPIRLSYALRGKHDACLLVKLGNEQVTSEVPAWVWAVAARFAVHPATAAVTMRNAPETAAEKLFHEHWNRKHGEQSRLTWARYHPELDDTLIGFHLIVADAMIANAEQYHTVVNGLDYSQPYAPASSGDAARRLRSARTLGALLRLESKPADCSMLNDVESDFVFSAFDGKLQIQGAANYQFSRRVRADFEPLKGLTAALRTNRHLPEESSPALYRAVDDFSQMVAFFNYVNRVDAAGLKTFVSCLQPVIERIHTIETPIGLPVKRAEGR